jgi:hypothetical protein
VSRQAEHDRLVPIPALPALLRFELYCDRGIAYSHNHQTQLVMAEWAMMVKMTMMMLMTEQAPMANVTMRIVKTSCA